MEPRGNGEVSRFPASDLRFRQTTSAISSLNEAWFHTLDEYVIDTPLRGASSLLRNCFFGGAVYALLLLQKGHGDQVASDIAGFITEEPRSCLPKPWGARRLIWPPRAMPVWAAMPRHCRRLGFSAFQ